MTELGTAGWLAVSAAWLAGSFGTGALLAALYKRLYPTLSFHKLWAVWTVVASLAALAILLVAPV